MATKCVLRATEKRNFKISIDSYGEIIENIWPLGTGIWNWLFLLEKLYLKVSFVMIS